MGGEKFKVESDEGFIMKAFVRIQDRTLSRGGEGLSVELATPFSILHLCLQSRQRAEVLPTNQRGENSRRFLQMRPS